MTVPRRLSGLTLDTLSELPGRCRSCVLWELDPVAREQAEAAGDVAVEKEAWLSAALLEWGSVGKVAHVGEDLAGFALYAPPAYVPRSISFPTSPPAPDAVLLMTVHVVPAYAGQGLGRLLVQGVAADLLRRGVRAIEAFGDATGHGACASTCVVPVDYLLAVGFKTVRPHHRYPRLRLDLKATASWRADVEVALERLLGPRYHEPAVVRIRS